MTRVSKQKLEKSAWKHIHNQFSKTLLDLERNRSGKAFLSDLLTETETIMLAKRLAVIFLLLEDVPMRKISETLKVSVSTVYRNAQTIDNGGFMAIRSFFRDKKRCQEFWKEIEVAIRFGMPAYTGKGRWVWLDELDKKYAIRR